MQSRLQMLNLASFLVTGVCEDGLHALAGVHAHRRARGVFVLRNAGTQSNDEIHSVMFQTERGGL